MICVTDFRRRKSGASEKNERGAMLLALSFLSALLLALCSRAEAQQMQEFRIAVIGAPEEPRFSEIVAGLKKGLGELGYTGPSLFISEAKIARAEEKNAKPLIEALLRQKSAGVLSHRFEASEAGSRSIGASARRFHHPRRSGRGRLGWKLGSSGREQHGNDL
jgi:hypothetical protein